MADSFSFGKVELVASTEEAARTAEPLSETPFRILVIGDFSGRGNRGLVDAEGLVGRRPIRVDRDDVDRVLAGLGVEIRLPVVGDDAPIVLRFRELEDFHPDQIYEHVDAFRALRDFRRKLNDPGMAAEALRHLEGAGTGRDAGQAGPAGKPGAAETPPPENLLEQILEESRSRPAPATAPGSAEAGPFAPFLARITAPYRTEAADPRLAEMVAAVDLATGELMAEILHHPDFQALEGAWRSVDLLVRRVDTDENLTVSLLDATRAELEAAGSKLIPASEPWAVVMVNTTFDATGRDIELLGRLAEAAQRAGAPIVAGAHPRFVGCESLLASPDPDDWETAIADPPARAAWAELRKRPEAAYVGLALPRVLLRLPYGQDDAPIDAFAFEELGAGAGAGAGEGSFLWGNPAVLVAMLLGQAFSRSGWQLRPGEVSEVNGLPLCVIRSGEDSAVVPCAGVSLSDRAAETVLDHGLMPLLAPRDRDAVRVGRFQSIAEPSSPLAGRWAR